MALVSPVIPPFYLAGPLTAEGLVLPISAGDAAALCALIGAGNHTYFRITSAQALEVVKAQCTGTVVQIDRAINESFAVAHPQGACVTVDMNTLCAVRDIVCQELDQCETLGATVSTALLATSAFPTALAANESLLVGLCESPDLMTCLSTSLLANETFVDGLVTSMSSALLLNTEFRTSLISSILGNAGFINGVTNAIASSQTLLTVVANAVLGSPQFCASVSSCAIQAGGGGGSGGGSGGGGGGTVIGGCPVPTITEALTPTTATVGTAYTGTFRVAQTTAIVVNNLPAGLTASLVVNTGLVTITGTPSSAGLANLTVSATNACGTATVTIVPLTLGTLNVSAAGGGAGACPQPDVIVQLTPSTAVAGAPYTGAITVTNTTGANVLGLPSWATASFDQGTQQITITGTPNAPMTGVTLLLTNACGGAFTSSIASGVAAGALVVTPPVLPGSPVPYIGTSGCDGSPFYATLYMQGLTALGATGWQLLQDAPSASWALPPSPGEGVINLLPFSGFNKDANHTIRAVGPWGTTNTVAVTHVYDHDQPCNPGGA